MAKPRIEWKFTPSSLLAIFIAASTVIVGFVRAEGRIDRNDHHLAEHSEALKSVSDALALAEGNNRVLIQWQEEQDRRIERIEAMSGRK